MAKVTCKRCGKEFTWADDMANQSNKKGSSTFGLCRFCRSRFWKNYKEKNVEN